MIKTNVQKLKQLLEENKNCYEFEKLFLTNKEIEFIIAIATRNKKRISLSNCEIELKDMTNKQIKNLFNVVSIKECKIFVSGKVKVSKNVEDVIKKYNILFLSDYFDYLLNINANSLKDIDIATIEKINLYKKDIRLVTIPSNPNFFQLIRNQEVVKVKLPNINFNNYNMNNVLFKDCTFSDSTLMSESFFQNIRNKQLIGCSLPPIDFKKHFIKDSSFMFVKFHKDTRFPEDIDFFQEFSVLHGCKFPPCNYMHYNFTNSNIRFCSFPEKSILPYSTYLANSILENSYPKYYIKKLYMLPIENVKYEDIIFKYGNTFTDKQKTMIYYKTK